MDLKDVFQIPGLGDRWKRSHRGVKVKKEVFKRNDYFNCECILFVDPLGYLRRVVQKPTFILRIRS